MSKREPQKYETTTRAGAKVRVTHGKNGRGETVSLQCDGWGYETLNVDPPRNGRSK